MDQERRPRLTLARLTKQRPRVLVPGSTEDTLQKKVIEDLSREGSREEVAAPDVVEVEDAGVPEVEAPLKRKRNSGTSGAGPFQPKKKADNYAVCAPPPLQRTLFVNPSREVVLESPPRVDPISGKSRVGPFDSRKKLRELNKEKRRLQDKSESRELEAQSLRGDLEASEKGRKEAEAEVARLLGEKKEIEAKLECVEAEFVVNFHNTEAYTNFFDYFTGVGHQEVLATLKTDHPDLDLGSLKVRFTLLDAKGEEDS
ncbi:Uncharacterized protein Adt_30536 [Abeliophyllum distichum]|uniref:Uncharacterized protein n=1 Tax=Abeliophyllum distichum TaxID=126358 RepID=A0ABD1RBL3_9LAMI